MDTPEKESFPHTPVPLAILTAIVYIAGFAMVAAWFALLVMGQPAPAPAPRSIDAGTCSVCGVVERVVEFERAGLQLSGDQSEAFVVLLAALGGRVERNPRPPKLYDTAVLHDDGSVRIVREHSAPQWKRGDRVRVVRGRIEPAVADASQTGRTPSPVPPVAQAP
jgi:hypothetical protein